MSEKKVYEKPRAEVISFRLEEELMTAGGNVDITASGPGFGGGGGPIPFDDAGLNDKSSYQLD